MDAGYAHAGMTSLPATTGAGMTDSGWFVIPAPALAEHSGSLLFLEPEWLCLPCVLCREARVILAGIHEELKCGLFDWDSKPLDARLKHAGMTTQPVRAGAGMTVRI